MMALCPFVLLGAKEPRVSSSFLQSGVGWPRIYTIHIMLGKFTAEVALIVGVQGALVIGVWQPMWLPHFHAQSSLMLPVWLPT